MYRHANWMSALVGAAALGIAMGPPAVAETSSPLDPDIPMARRTEVEFANTHYRYDFGERHLTFGLEGSAGFPAGNTLNAFPMGGTVTPYFRGAFGDGNALEFDLTVGGFPPSGQNAEWLFFRTPIEEGATASGLLAFVAPIVVFRYDMGLTASIAHRARVFLWMGVGMGPAFTKGKVSLTNNGSQPDKTVTNFEVFYDLVPTMGFKFHFTEFAFVQLGLRYHLLWVIGSKVNGADEMTYGRPDVVPEFWIGNSRMVDLSFGLGYDFG